MNNIDIMSYGLESKKPFVISSVNKTCGSVPQKSGARMITFVDGSTYGTVGGGCVEGSVIKKSIDMIINNKNFLIINLDLNGNPGEVDADVCGGSINLFLELIK